MNPIILPRSTVITVILDETIPPEGKDRLPRCPVCTGLLNGKQKYDKDRCRVIAFKIRLVDKLVKDFRERLIEAIVK